MTLNVSDEEICCVNTKQFWLEHYAAKHELLSVVPSHFSQEKN